MGKMANRLSGKSKISRYAAVDSSDFSTTIQQDWWNWWKREFFITALPLNPVILMFSAIYHIILC